MAEPLVMSQTMMAEDQGEAGGGPADGFDGMLGDHVLVIEHRHVRCA